MAGRSLESRPVTHLQAAPQGQEAPTEPQPEEKSSNSVRGLRTWRNFNIVTGAGWAAFALATGGAGAVVGGTMAAIDGAQVVGTHVAANKLEEKQKQQSKQELIEAKNGKYMSTASGKGKNIDISPRDKFPLRTRRSGQYMTERQNTMKLEVPKNNTAQETVVYQAKGSKKAYALAG